MKMKKKKRKKLRKMWEKSATNGKDFSEIRLCIRVEHETDISRAEKLAEFGTGSLGRVERSVFIKGGKEVDKFSYALHKKLAEILKDDILIFMEAVNRETAGDDSLWYEAPNLSEV